MCAVTLEQSAEVEQPVMVAAVMLEWPAVGVPVQSLGLRIDGILGSYPTQPVRCSRTTLTSDRNIHSVKDMG